MKLAREAGFVNGWIMPSSPHLEVVVVDDGRAEHVSLRGTLDFSTVSPLREAVLGPPGCVRHVVILELDQVEFLDAQGIAMLVSIHQLMVRRSGELILACTHPHLRTRLRISRLDSVVRVVGSPSDAGALHRARPGDECWRAIGAGLIRT